ALPAVQWHDHHGNRHRVLLRVRRRTSPICGAELLSVLRQGPVAGNVESRKEEISHDVGQLGMGKCPTAKQSLYAGCALAALMAAMRSSIWRVSGGTMPSRRCTSMSWPRWCISCSLGESIISKRDLVGGTMP